MKKEYSINEQRNYVLSIFFNSKKKPAFWTLDKLFVAYFSNSPERNFGVERNLYEVYMQQLIESGYLIKTEDGIAPTIKGEEFYLEGGFCPPKKVRNLRWLKKYEITILSVIALLIALLGLVVSIIEMVCQ